MLKSRKLKRERQRDGQLGGNTPSLCLTFRSWYLQKLSNKKNNPSEIIQKKRKKGGISQPKKIKK